MKELLAGIHAELVMLRKMKMVELAERGYSQAKLGNMLGISQATVSRMMATRKAPARSERTDGDV